MTKPGTRVLRPPDPDPLLRGERHRSIAGSRGVCPGNQEGVRRLRLSDGHAERAAIRDFLLVDGHSDRGVGRSLESSECPRARRGDVERDDRAVRDGRELHDAVPRRASVRPSAKRVAAHHRTRSSLTTFPKARRGTAFAHLRAGGSGGDVDWSGNRRVGQSEPGMAEYVHRHRPPRHRARAHRVPHREGTTARDVRRAVGARGSQKTPGMMEVLGSSGGVLRFAI